MKIADCCLALLLALGAVELRADQATTSVPKDLNFFIGKWELAVGQHSISGPFDRMLELSVDGSQLTGTMTIDTRTVKVVGAFGPNFYLRSVTGTVSFTGTAWDGSLLTGCYFQGMGASARMTGWAARRPTLTR